MAASALRWTSSARSALTVGATVIAGDNPGEKTRDADAVSSVSVDEPGASVVWDEGGGNGEDLPLAPVSSRGENDGVVGERNANASPSPNRASARARSRRSGLES